MTAADLDLYNADFKEKYLNEMYNENSQITVRYVLAKAATTERLLGKDLAAFNINELEYVLNNLNGSSIGALRSNVSLINKYISYGIEHGYSEGGNINPLDGLISDEWLSKFVSSSKTLFSEKEIIDVLSHLENYQDQLPIQLAFEGILGQQMYEQRTLKIDDYCREDSTITVRDKDGSSRTVKISERTEDLIWKAYDQKVYVVNNGASEKIHAPERKLAESYYLLKKLQKKNVYTQPEGDLISYQSLFGRLQKAKELLGNESLTFKSLSKSGQIKMAVDMFTERGKLGKEEFEAIAKQYNLTPMTIIKGKEYAPIPAMRRHINRNTILELYNIDIEA